MARALSPLLAPACAIPTRVSDAELLEAAYRDHHEAVRAFARRLLGDGAVAEDLVQETFVAFPPVARRAPSTEPLAARALLLGICANRAKHHVRAAARRRAAMDRLGALGGPDAPHGPESETMRAQLRAALHRALDTLSHDHRVVVVLCDVEERTSSEVAAILGIPEGTVRTRLFHARKYLRERFDEEGR